MVGRVESVMLFQEGVLRSCGLEGWVWEVVGN